MQELTIFVRISIADSGRRFIKIFEMPSILGAFLLFPAESPHKIAYMSVDVNCSLSYKWFGLKLAFIDARILNPISFLEATSRS